MKDTIHAGKSLVFTVIASFATCYFLDYNFAGLLVFPLSILVTFVTSVIELKSPIAIILIVFFGICTITMPIFEFNETTIIIGVSIVVGIFSKYLLI